MKQFAINSENASFRFLYAVEPFLKSIHLKVTPGECVSLSVEKVAVAKQRLVVY